MKKTLYPIPILFFLISFQGITHSQIITDVKINSSPNPVGSGARATGMGGAFIAIADDATAASWNPGGLMQLETPEFSMVGACDISRDDFDSNRHPESSSMNEITRYDLNYLSVAYPFQIASKNMIVSLNYQKLYDLHKDMDFRVTSTGRLPGFPEYKIRDKVRFRQRGSLKALSPAYAIQITPRFSVGATFNIWTDRLFWNNDWTTKTEESFSGIGVTGTTYRNKRLRKESFSHFKGFNMNFGFLWDINPTITIGAVFKTPFKASFHYRYQETQKVEQPAIGKIMTSSVKFSEHRELKMPMSYGLGIAVRLSNILTLSFDVYRTNWSRFFMEDKDNHDTSPINGVPRKHSHVHDTTQLHLGGEYLLMLEKTIIPLRTGLFYDPQPSQKHPDDFFGFSLGSGVMLGNHVLLDWAYQMRYGHNVSGGSLGGIADAKADVIQHKLMVSMIYHF
ncbi:MAG: outer membrane protein transport protein [Thermodesulfobacteriota bacterium]|jgi:long-subunit fatty acid transport protein